MISQTHHYYTATRWLLDGFFAGIHIGLICQPLQLLHVAVQPAIAMLIVNPVVDKGTVLATVELTLIFGDSQTLGLSFLRLPFLHLHLFLRLAFVPTRTSLRLDRNQVLER